LQFRNHKNAVLNLSFGETTLVENLLFALLVLLSVCSIVGIVFANPIPWDPWGYLWNLDTMQYFSITVAEFCGLVVGTFILIHNRRTRWQKAAVTMLMASISSFVLGIVIWTLGYRTGILVHNLMNPSPLGTLILSLPEVLGVVVGTIIIHVCEKVEWKMAIVAMTAAMLTSFLIGIYMAVIVLACSA